MTCLDRGMYRDPMLVLQDKQQREINRKAGMERVCNGCIHKRTLLVGDEKVQACALKRGFRPTIWCDHKQTESN